MKPGKYRLVILWYLTSNTISSSNVISRIVHYIVVQEIVMFVYFKSKSLHFQTIWYLC